jgi:hypothetical protein
MDTPGAARLEEQAFGRDVRHGPFFEVENDVRPAPDDEGALDGRGFDQRGWAL